MDKKKLDYFRKRLETRQQELRRTVTRTQQDGRSADEDSAQDIADRAASSYNKEFLFSQSNNERQLLQMVDSALVRIRQGNSGSAYPAAGRSIPSAWKRCLGPSTASNARRSLSRACWKKLRGRSRVGLFFQGRW